MYESLHCTHSFSDRRKPGMEQVTQQTYPALLELTAQGGRYGQSTNSQMGFLGDEIILIRPQPGQGCGQGELPQESHVLSKAAKGNRTGWRWRGL